MQPQAMECPMPQPNDLRRSLLAGEARRLAWQLLAIDSVIMVKAAHMSRPAPEIRLSTKEREILLRWMRSFKTEQRMVERARVILLASNGLSGKEVALKMQTREARISKWLRRFAQDRIAGLDDSALGRKAPQIHCS
jgi:Helix-turn-helix domain